MESKWHNIEQNTEEWLDLRVGKITSSGVAKIMANLGKGFGDPAKRYAIQLARERVTGMRSKSGRIYTSDMQRGDDMEPVARSAYEEYYMHAHRDLISAREGGFFEMGNLGDSPDAIIGSPPKRIDGVLEIKCPSDEQHYDCISGKFKFGYPPMYRWQIYHHLNVTRAKWCDFVSYNPDFGKAELYVYRIWPNSEVMDTMNDRIAEFEELVSEREQVIREYYQI